MSNSNVRSPLEIDQNENDIERAPSSKSIATASSFRDNPSSQQSNHKNNNIIFSTLNYIVTLPFLAVLFLIAQIRNMFSMMMNNTMRGTSSIVLTKKQEEIMKEVPVLQKEMQNDVDQLGKEQQRIGKDLDELKIRIQKIEERRKKRAENLATLNNMKKD